MTAAQLLARADTRAGMKPDALADWLRELAAQGWLVENEHGFHMTDAGRRRFAGLEELPTPRSKGAGKAHRACGATNGNASPAGGSSTSEETGSAHRARDLGGGPGLDGNASRSTDPVACFARSVRITENRPCNSNSVCLGSCRLPGPEARSMDFGLSAGILAAGPVPQVYSLDLPAKDAGVDR